jgi:MHS family alpha-ketoglutarate permease-like MFS transporter
MARQAEARMATATAAVGERRMTTLARVKAILGGSAGNLVEWYDWFAYASFTLYFAKVFFPKGDQTAQLLQTAAIFAVGFLARPVGAWLFGLYGDRAGRKAALTLSVALMCLGSLMVAVTPGYDRIGAAAPAVLTLARILQGLSVGGEYGASATYMSEVAGNTRRGFWSSFQFTTIVGGQLLALGVLMVMQALLSSAQLSAWGWRVPFVIGAGLAVVVFAIQMGLEESKAFTQAHETPVRAATTLDLVVRHPRQTAAILILSSGGGLAFYCFTTYMQKYLTNSGHFSPASATRISAGSLVVFLVAQPVMGWIGDMVGRTRLMAAGFALGALSVYPIMTALARTREPLVALLLVCAALVFLTGYTAVNAVVKAELFPTRVRALGVALPYAVANALFGGTAEYVALDFKQGHLERGFFIYVAVIMGVAAVTALLMGDPKRLGLIDED